MKYLFLDLEDTTIAPIMEEGFSSIHLINKSFIRNTIASIDPARILIFSHALHSDHDLRCFELFIKPRLETTYGREITAPYHLGHFTHASEQIGGYPAGSLKLGTLRSLRNKKTGSFFDFLAYTFKEEAKDNEFYLVDDEVSNHSVCLNSTTKNVHYVEVIQESD